MKKLIPVLLALCLLAAPMIVMVSAGNNEQVIPQSFASETNAPDVVFLAGSVPADSKLTDAITLPIHALVLSMLEHELTYDVWSAPFVWNALYYALSLYGQTDERAQLTDEALLLPSEVVNDFSRALFAELNELPALPAELEGFVSCDPASDVYILALGDFALTRIQLDALAPLPDGSFALNGSLTSLEDGSPLCSFLITLVENDSMFGFSILDVSLT